MENTEPTVFSLGHSDTSSFFKDGDSIKVLFNCLRFKPGMRLTPAPGKPFALRIKYNNLKLGGYCESELQVEAQEGYHGDFNHTHLKAGTIYWPYEEPKESPEWVVECEDPLEIRHVNLRDTATGVFAQFIIDNY